MESTSNGTRALRVAQVLFLVGAAVMIGSLFGPLYQLGTAPYGWGKLSMFEELRLELYGSGRRVVIAIGISQIIGLVAAFLLIFRVASAKVMIALLRVQAIPLFWTCLCLLVVPKGNGWGLWTYSAGCAAVFLSTLLPRMTVPLEPGGFEVIVAQPASDDCVSDILKTAHQGIS